VTPKARVTGTHVSRHPPISRTCSWGGAVTLRHCLVVFFLVVLAPARTWAQTPSYRRALFVDVQLAPSWDDVQSDSTRVPGRTWARGLAIGVDGRTRGIEVDVIVPQWHTTNSGPHRFQFVGPTSGYEQQGHFYETSGTERRRSIDVTLLRRASVRFTGRTRFTWLVGGAYVYRPTHTTSVTKEVLPDGRLEEVHSSGRSSTRNHLAAVARVDLELRLTRSLLVVPRLRMTVFPLVADDSGFAPRFATTRPEVALRWRF
jgi:hypothetical protein